MALTKTVVDDKVEIVGDTKEVQIRTATIIKEDDVELSRSFHRRVLECVTSVYDKDDSSWTHTDTDISSESTEIQGICSAVWTDEVKALKKSIVEAT